MILVDEDTLKLAAGTDPKRTLVAPVNPVPFMVTDVPPVLGPELGESEVTAGSGPAADVNRSAGTNALVPPGVVTMTLCVPAEAKAGEVA